MDLNAVVGKQYHLSMHRTGFGNYWCAIEILEVKPKKTKNYRPGTMYSIKYRKITSPYDEYLEDFTKKHYPNAKQTKYAREVWVHNEFPDTWNRRVLEI
jgi:hypothetical protein